jgi:hypothetical protein
MVSQTFATTAEAASASVSPSFFMHHFSQTRSSSDGSEHETSEASLLRNAIPRCLTILSTIAASAAAS